MKIRDFEPHSSDNFIQKRNQQAVGRASFAQVGLINEDDSTPIALANVPVAFDLTYVIDRKTLQTGQATRIKAMGKYSTKGGTTPSLTLAVKLGGEVLCSTGPVTLGDGVTDKAWVVHVTAQCRVAGDSGQVIAFLEASFDGVSIHRPAGSPATVSTNDDLPIEIVATWSAADAANTAVLQMLVPEFL